MNKISRSDRQNAGGEKDCAGCEPSDGLDTRRDDATAAAAGDAPVGAGLLFNDFEAFWQSLVDRNPAIASDPGPRLRGFTLHDLKEALREAFEAGRATCNL